MLTGVKILALSLSVACGQAPTAPGAVPAQPTAADASTRTLRLVLSGQSNAGWIKPFLEERASVVGYSAYAGIAISPCWDDVPTRDNAYDGRCWAELKPQLSPTLDAFVWWQGDAEVEHPDYAPKLAALVQRVRAQASCCSSAL